MLAQKTIDRIGWIASIMAMLLFVSYIDQIRLNLSGQPGSMLIPAATILNCLAWLAYGGLREQKDWPIMACNGLGVLVGGVTLATAVMAMT
ncbi:SemiSWEET family transporter [Thaumasiovibrio subtropicus]|uniref:SemiSWEET family transporter n=1 Tax=Thaumasiovibrio subtropicus TaxID=1891207 RepID=UPI00192D04D5|nr:SemiSWEET family transporter [Thaumasiovibrio subtropicus]